MLIPEDVQIVGAEVAVRWSDGVESYFPGEFLRAASPSAANIGERDIFGRQWGGDARTRFPGVVAVSWERIGNYAIRFQFSDGHGSGLFAYDYLRRLHDRLQNPPPSTPPPPSSL
jgi:DUF971 family protein